MPLPPTVETLPLSRVQRLPSGTAREWLAACGQKERFYWRGPDGREVAAFGTTLELSSLEQADDCLQTPGAFVLGAMNFDTVAETWPGFSGFGLRIPRQVLHNLEGVPKLHLFHPADDFPASWPSLKSRSSGQPNLLQRFDEPQKTDWTARVLDVLQHIEQGALQKAVPARKTRLEFSQELRPWELFNGLQAITPGCFHFAVEGRENSCFLGASPEMLYAREGRQIRSEAIAGTRLRGTDAATDEALGQALLESAKEHQEHAAVAGMIRKTLGELAIDTPLAEPCQLLQLARVQHLVTRFSATLRPEVRDADILQLLHCTPATCGLPVAAARAWIRENEAFSRGCYAAPVGWMTPERACFAVGLRSGLVQGNTLDLFAGAGIVRGSQPEREWEELDSKIADWMSLFQK